MEISKVWVDPAVLSGGDNVNVDEFGKEVKSCRGCDTGVIRDKGCG